MDKVIDLLLQIDVHTQRVLAGYANNDL